MNAKRIARVATLAAAAALIGLFASSCKTIDKWGEDSDDDDNNASKAPRIVTAHEIVKYPRSTDAEINAPCFDGSTRCINRNSFIYSGNITKIAIVPIRDNPGFYDLDVTLDKSGRVLWAGATVKYRDTPVAFAIDGTVYREFVPEQLESDTDMVVRIKGPFDEVTAKALQANAPKNYKKLNGKE